MEGGRDRQRAPSKSPVDLSLSTCFSFSLASSSPSWSPPLSYDVCCVTFSGQSEQLGQQWHIKETAMVAFNQQDYQGHLQGCRRRGCNSATTSSQ